MIDRGLLLNVHDQTGLVALLRTDEGEGGLGWPIADAEDAFQVEPEIAEGIKGDGTVTVSRLIPASADDKHMVILAEFDWKYDRRDLRALLTSLRRHNKTTARFPEIRGVGDTIFIVASPAYEEVRVVLFESREQRLPRIRSFGWSADDIGRTIQDYNLPSLDWSNRSNWVSAWDVERVTDEFFKEYRDVFGKVEELVTGVKGDKRLFIQRLFNRLLFIQFLSRKGWLRFNGSTDFLKALWDGRNTKANFYGAHLVPLFFAGLNNPQGRNLNRQNPALQSLIGDVPFLNGGLFEKAEEEGQGEVVPDEAISLIVNELFARWNFTITESTPLDIDVAVDPEMLGKVFEELVTGRQKTGSYYTPRTVVAFMCREALKGYLGGFESLIDEHDAAGIGVDEARELIRKLESIKVCDPACGSGAYLLGMLQEIHALQRLLDTTAHRRTARDDYERKLTIIENCLYGVDIDPFAVNIAWLRLWLALVIDDSRNPLDQPDEDVSLPNLDVKIGVGDSLLAPDPHRLLVADQLSLVKPLIEDYRREKGEYMRAHTKEE